MARVMVQPRELNNCILLPETPTRQAFWGCCKCQDSNGLQRPICRICGHERCGEAVARPLTNDEWTTLETLFHQACATEKSWGEFAEALVPVLHLVTKSRLRARLL